MIELSSCDILHKTNHTARYWPNSIILNTSADLEVSEIIFTKYQTMYVWMCQLCLWIALMSRSQPPGHSCFVCVIKNDNILLAAIRHCDCSDGQDRAVLQWQGDTLAIMSNWVSCQPETCVTPPWLAPSWSGWQRCSGSTTPAPCPTWTRSWTRRGSPWQRSLSRRTSSRSARVKTRN